ncbi:MAG: sugar ABC transporter permease [Anaerolineales bacterium]|nr:sugar ABC transporter permease [Anaerolineales bacterium]
MTDAMMVPKTGDQKWWQKRKFQQYAVAFLFVLPALINFTVFRYYPMIWSARASFWEYSLLGGFKENIGWENYIRMINDEFFWDSLLVTGKFFLMYVPAVVIFAMALALFSNQKKPGMGTIRAVIFVPVVTSFVVVSILWGMLLNKDVGLVNSILASLGFGRISFLLDKENALPTIAMISIWKNVGYSVIILVAGLKGVPEELFDAAVVDGASPWKQFIHITLPMIRRQLMFVTVWATLGAFQVFIPVYSLTGGGPRRATNVIVYYIYSRAFKFGEMGYASALSIALLLILLIVSVVQMRLLRRDY